MCPAIMNGISCLSLSVFPLLPLSPVAHPVWRASVCDTLTDQKDLDICLPRPVNARSTSTLCSVTFSVKQAVLPTLPTPPPPSAVNKPPLHQIMATWELYRIRWTDAYLRTWCHRHQGLPLLWLTLYEPHCGIPHLPTHPLHSSELWVSSRVMPISVCPWYASFVNPIPT